MDDAKPLHALTIDEQSGNIAVADEQTVFIYKPLGRDYGDLRWTRTCALPSESGTISYLSWGSSDELLVAAAQLNLWNFTNEHEAQLIWTSELSSPLLLAIFSPDGGLIASCAHHDRIVKVWRRLSYEQDSTRFDVSYLPHPKAVTDLSWRCLWHQEQNLDNLLYTFCCDKHVRVWAHSDPHAYCSLQKVVTIDTAGSLQPRRMSMGSVSKRRFSFIVQSKDIARAAERALQTRRSATDHALEHLIEVANRSPEVCVILDGLGHMSAWGIENAGVKSKLATDKFNVALVDGVSLALTADDESEDYHQILAFANNDISATLCVLVQSYTGQINWYEGSYVSFFDTAANPERLKLRACWSGHSSVVEKLISSHDYRSFLSVSAAHKAILWSLSQSDALTRRSMVHAEKPILDAVLLSESRFAAVLHHESIAIWDVKASKAKLIAKSSVSAAAKSIDYFKDSESAKMYLKISTDSRDILLYSLYLPSGTKQQQSNGYHEIIQLVKTLKSSELATDGEQSFFVDSTCSSFVTSSSIVAASEAGHIQHRLCKVEFNNVITADSNDLATHTALSRISTALDDEYIAVVHIDGRTLSIWNLKQSSYEYTWAISDLDEIRALHWHRLKHGYAVLAVQSTFSVAILTQRNYQMSAKRQAWNIYTTITTRNISRLPISACCWHSNERLAFALGNQIVTLDVDDQTHFTETARKTRLSTVPFVGETQLLNSTVLIFKPEILQRYLQAGDFEKCNTIFSALHDQLRFLTQDELVDIPITSTLSLFKQEAGAISKHPIEQNEHSNFDLAENTERLRDGVLKISPQQLNRTEKDTLRKVIDIAVMVQDIRQSIDSCAQRYFSTFLLALSKSAAETNELEPLPCATIVQATRSNTQEALLNHVLGKLEETGFKLTWEVARSLGLFMWISDKEILAQQFEAVARNEYNANPDDRNPVDCTLYYLALDKKAVLVSLWRRTIGVKEKEATMKLLAHNFQEQKWKSSALKNAYALLSRRRFEYAAAFFLLGGSLSDAVNVCVNQMHDIQLAIAITRVWTGSQEVQSDVMDTLFKKITPICAVDTYEARWLLIWAAVQKDDWARVISCIAQPIDQLLERELTNRAETRQNDQNPFGAQSYAANDPTLLVKSYQDARKVLVDRNQWTRDILSPAQEWQFLMRCVNWYSRAGLHWLAVDLVANWQFCAWQEPKKSINASAIARDLPVEAPAQKSALDEWLVPGEIANGTSKNDVEPPMNEPKQKPKPAPTQFVEPSADSLLDSFGF